MSKSLIFQNLFLHTISLGEIIEQKENQSQNWKKYYFFLHGGELKSYRKGPPSGQGEGLEPKNNHDLLCCDVEMIDDYTIQISKNKKLILLLKFPTDKKASLWYDSLLADIKLRNISALQVGNLRSSELTEWYFSYQNQLKLQAAEFIKGTTVTLSDGFDETFPFKICITDDLTSLIFSATNTNNGLFSSLKSINDGRKVLIKNFISYTLVSPSWNIESNQTFSFILNSTEDEFHFIMGFDGIAWLKIFQELVLFNLTTKPNSFSMSSTSAASSSAAALLSSSINTNFLSSSHANTTVSPLKEATLYSNQSSLNSNNSLLDSHISYQSTSNYNISISYDINLFLNNFNKSSLILTNKPLVNSLEEKFKRILALFAQIKYNKTINSIFLSRIEQIIRYLGDSYIGILLNITKKDEETFINIIKNQLLLLLDHMTNFLVYQTSSGWLQLIVNKNCFENLYSSSSYLLNNSSTSFTSKSFSLTSKFSFSSNLGNNSNTSVTLSLYEFYDTKLCNIIKEMIQILSKSNATSFNYDTISIEAKSYSEVVDLKAIVGELGGLAIINSDLIKQQTLCRIIQANQDDIKVELDLIYAPKKVTTATSKINQNKNFNQEISSSSTVSSINIGNEQQHYSVDSLDENLYSKKKKSFSFFSCLCPCFVGKVSNPELKQDLLR